ncbi:hypothetical protein SCH4B_1651 [Ruegeria sp. TrichCH4B]|nr:hypothetical protein SCH4B_1651 [Ruegeria sp. TrichCH4B]
MSAALLPKVAANCNAGRIKGALGRFREAQKARRPEVNLA